MVPKNEVTSVMIITIKYGSSTTVDTMVLANKSS